MVAIPCNCKTVSFEASDSVGYNFLISSKVHSQYSSGFLLPAEVAPFSHSSIKASQYAVLYGVELFSLVFAHADITNEVNTIEINLMVNISLAL